jgi:DNA-binding transcriptional ArsR family regulator
MADVSGDVEGNGWAFHGINLTGPLARCRQATILNHMVQYSKKLDAGFAALSDPTRRGILDRLGRGDASITDLADAFAITLTGIKKHVQVLEAAGLVTTEKIGRTRTCRLGPRKLDQEAEFIASYRRMLEDRLTRLEDFLERTK